MDTSLKRINEMESILDECREVLDELGHSLDHLKRMEGRMGQLFSYYGSEAWYEDRDTELPSDVKAGVLSEDLIYDTIIDTRDVSFRMLEMATDMLKNRI